MENKEEIKKNSFLIIDGNSIMNRAFYGIKLLATKDGLYTNAIYGFLNIYFMMQEKLNPKYVAVAFDVSAPTFRHKMYSEYKAGRHAMPVELKSQMPLIKEVLDALNIPILEKEGFEADDILGTVAALNTKNGIPTYILTGDRDSFQLISDTATVVLPTTKMGKTEYTYYTPELLYEKYAIRPNQVPDVKALMGDSSDNIPGVPGIGEKTAYPLINKYESIEKIYENVRGLDISPSVMGKLEKFEESARQSKVLATINTNVELNINYESLKLTEPNMPELIKLFTRFEFKKFIEKFTKNLDAKLDISTDNEKEFYRDFNSTKYVNIQNELDIDKLKSISKTISITIIDNNLHDMKDILCVYTNNTVYIISENMFKEALEVICKLDVEKVSYNLKKIERIAFDLGISNFNRFNSDIMIEYYLLHASENNYTIENIAYNVIDVPMPKIVKEKTNVQTTLFDILDSPQNNNAYSSDLSEDEKRYIYYVMNSILKVNSILYKELQENNLEKLYNEIELPLVEVLAATEHNGMYVNKERLIEFGNTITSRIDEITKRIYELSGESFNINSPQQLAHVLFEVLNIPYPKKTKSSYSTDKETLESIVGDYEIVDLVLEYRTYAKLKSTYVDGLLDVIGPDGRIHTTFTQTVTVTGRLSSIDPNLQNIPVKTELGGKIRDCFTSQGDNLIIDADYSQIELRVLAHMSEDAELIKGFVDDIDIHSITASQVFGVPLSEVTKELRSKAKAVNFGIVYGISEYGLAKNINSTRPDAAKYMRNYLAHYSGVDSYMKHVIEEAKEKGVVKTIFGRMRTVPELKSANYLTRNFGERIAMNMPIQGTAADIMKLAMIKVYNKLKEKQLAAKLIMQVHDELIIEAPPSETEDVKQILKDCMENAATLKVPLKVDVNVGKTWLEAK